VGAAAGDLLSFISRAPSPFHAAAEAARRLVAAGFETTDPQGPWADVPDRGVMVRGGALVAWVVGAGGRPGQPFRILGAHTDSPNLRIKPRPDTGRVGFRQLGVEVYGGALLNSWLDRDLGLSGRVVVRDRVGAPLREELVVVDRPVLRVPQLAIHLDREINDRGLALNRQQHLSPIWALGSPVEGDLAAWLSDIVGGEVLSWDLMVHDCTPGALLGRDEQFLVAGRIDNLASCWAATDTLCRLDPDAGPATTTVMALYDHEEIGSQSATGAASVFLSDVLQRITAGRHTGDSEHRRAMAASWCLSVDGAHATHPNYPDRHEPAHTVRLGGGPVLKHNSNERYATHAPGAAVVAVAAEQAGVPLQHFVTRSDLACGSTIGPATAAHLGVPTVDLGLPMLSMHSARELCGTEDPWMLRALLEALCTTGAPTSP